MPVFQARDIPLVSGAWFLAENIWAVHGHSGREHDEVLTQFQNFQAVASKKAGGFSLFGGI